MRRIIRNVRASEQVHGLSNLALKIVEYDLEREILKNHWRGREPLSGGITIPIGHKLGRAVSEIIAENGAKKRAEQKRTV